MIVNLIIICFILISGLMFYEDAGIYANSRYYRKRYILLICFILILQSGLRNVAVGADTYYYFENFEYIKSTTWEQIWAIITDYYTKGIGKDPGYFAFEKIAQVFFRNYQIYLLFIASLFFSALGNFIYKNTKRLSDAIFAFVLYSSLFYGFFSFTGIRQTISTAATLYSYELVKKRKILPFLLIIGVASTIHQSCLIFLPFYYIARIKKAEYFLYGILIAFPLLFLISASITDFFQSLSLTYQEYSHYPEYTPYNFTILMLLVAVFTLIRYKRVIRIIPQARQYYNAFGVSIFFLSLVFQIHGFMRIVQYFSIFMLLLIPLTIETFKQRDGIMKRKIYTAVIILLLVFLIQSSWNFEYKFFWQEMELGENYK